MDTSAIEADEDAQVVRGPSRVAARTVCTDVIAREARELQDLTLMTSGCRLGVHVGQ